MPAIFGTIECGCARCAALQRTCCQDREVLLTEGDRSRIRVATGRDDFWERRVPGDSRYLDQADDPPWNAWTVASDGTRMVVKLQPGGDCRFLGARGCALAMEVRPLICRLHPYTYTFEGLGGYCGDCHPAAITPGRSPFDVLGITLDDAGRWHHMLYAELEAEARSRLQATGHRPQVGHAEKYFTRRDRRPCAG
jgi:Fe-S-cluster containining protein